MSATPWQVDKAREMLVGGMGDRALADASDGRASGFGWMTPRQQWLTWLWSQFRCSIYDDRRVNWSGRERLPKTEHDMVARQGYIPPGFYDAGQTLPIEFRAPDAPTHLPKVITTRFTSLLFSSHRHPRIACPEDPATADWLTAAVEAARLWTHMQLARNYGGATGTAVIGFKFVRGRLQFEVFDPRWCEPDFLDQSTGELYAIEKKYQYSKWMRNPANGEQMEVRCWYRRVIDQESDTVWPCVPVQDQNEEPEWETFAHTQLFHGMQECPVHWIQNKEVLDEPDGDSDCHGVYELCWAIDALWSQSHHGALKNCDPTLHVASDADFDSVSKGSHGSAMKTEKGGSMEYVEMTGAGIKTATDLAEKLEQRVQQLARCYFDKNLAGTGTKTATEVERDYSAMIEEADVLREQYGQKGVKPLLEKILRCARRLMEPYVDYSNPDVPRIMSSEVKVPPRPVKDDTGKVVGLEERDIGQGETVDLKWPRYFQPTLEDIVKAVQAARSALEGGLIDQEHAMQMVAEYFQVEDVAALLEALRREAEKLTSEAQQIDQPEVNAFGEQQKTDEQIVSDVFARTSTALHALQMAGITFTDEDLVRIFAGVGVNVPIPKVGAPVQIQAKAMDVAAKETAASKEEEENAGTRSAAVGAPKPPLPPSAPGAAPGGAEEEGTAPEQPDQEAPEGQA